MSNKTFYIQPDVQLKLEQEPNMGGLVNKLLAKHYKLILNKQNNFAEIGVRSSIKHELRDNKLVSTVTPNPDDVKKKLDKFAELKSQLDTRSSDKCSHGFAKGMCKKDECNRKYR